MLDITSVNLQISDLPDQEVRQAALIYETNRHKPWPEIAMALRAAGIRRELISLFYKKWFRKNF